ncbi:LPS assembly protein LptD [Azoarcus indigens]|uniref:LPS-assembly protein LptD n=2 Tax=Azoarcus indigens TaxID=29545 RepID=A0A4R6DMH1_9RHOO|nr:LPS assembly protein LptD [Azoarcus indigens]TDN46081.1 LPS-assembly protein [Azoarcus indigens]
MGLKTRMRLIPLLLCWMSGTAFAAGLSPLVVSPDLVRGSRDKAATPAAAQAADKPAAQQGAVTEKPAAATAAPSSSSSSAVEVRPVRPAGDEGAAVGVPVQPRPSAGASGQVVRPEQTRAPVAMPAAQPSAATPAPGGTEIRALRISGTRAVEMVADGDAELQRGETVLSADKLTYREPTDEALADGNVRLREGQSQVTGPAAQLVVGEQVGEFQSPAYRITRERPSLIEGEPPRVVSGGGQADVMYFEGENHYRLENATWSTCTPDDPDWYIKARDLQLDYDREIGTARSGTVVFKDVPLLWTPWAEFPLVGQRQSGLLAPTFGTSNKTGLDLSVPYYWNIAPNYDATIAPRYMSRRGLQLAIEGRYLGETYKGEARVEWLPRDNVSGEERSLGSWQHQQWLTPQLYASFDVNGVSDDEYFEDLSTRISVASKVNLVREGRLMYVGGDWWSASALVQSYQTLNADPDVTYTTPYRRLPQLMLNANRPDLIGGLAATFQSEYVKFAHPDEGMPEGTRVTVYPSLSLPIQRAGYYITPKIGVHQTQYDLDRGLPGGRDSITRTVPIYSVDAGMTFERDINLFGSDYVQTLEPRLYYLNVPYRRQDDIPIFDTSRYDFGFAQIFSENLYTGGDRIADANQITAAVTTRLIDPTTGGERLRALIGQRYYFEDQRVTINQLGGSVVEEPRTGRRADILAGFSGHFNRENSLDSLIQYNPRDNWTERFNVVYRYQPDFAKALNLSYRYARDILRDVDVSGQWPLGGRWYGVSRLTHSLKDDRLTEAIAGLEYDGGCWVFRVAAHRFATNSEDTTQAFFIQLELNDLASIGTSPVSLIKRSVPGYGTINEPVSNRVFGFD